MKRKLIFFQLLQPEELVDRSEKEKGSDAKSVGEQLHPSPGSVEGYPSPKEPPTPEASKDILHWKILNVDDSSGRAKCVQGRRHRRRPTSKERGNLRPSRVRGWRERGQAEEPPTRSRLRRNPRGGRDEQPPARPG